MKQLNRLGITSVTDPIVGPEQLRDYIALLDEGEFPLRVNSLLNWSWPSMASTVSQLKEVLAAGGFASGLGNEWLRVGGCKLFADGVPSLQTAWMHEPYGGGGCGSLVTRGETEDERTAELFAMIELSHRHRLQVQVHATGDRAIDTVVDGFVRAAQADPWPEARHVVIHSNFVSAHTAALMAQYGFGAITNSLIKWQTSETSRSLMAEARWHRNMPARSLVEGGVHLADSSDAPITYPDWRQAIEMLVLRKVRSSGVVSGPGERLTREQAIRAWTIEAAYLEHAENLKGSIEPGKLADLVVVDEHPLSVDAHELHGVRPVLTILGGRVVHAASPQLADL
jgi:hypothetical protein